MKRQTIAVLAMGSFMIFSFSCTSIREIKPETLSSRKAKDLAILKLEKTSGELIVFSESRPGAVVENTVQGIGAIEGLLVTMEIDKAQVKRIIRHGDQVVSVTTQDNITYPVQKIIQKPEAFEIWTLKSVQPLLFESISVSIEQVQKAYTTKLDIWKTFEAVLAGAATLVIFDYFLDLFSALLYGIRG